MKLPKTQSSLVKSPRFQKIGAALSVLLVIVSGYVIYSSHAATSTPGLSATYYNNADFTGTSVKRVDKQISFNWGTTAPIAGIDPSTYSVRWTGGLKAPVTGTVKIGSNSDDGVRVWVDNQLVVNSWTTHTAMDNSGSLKLVAGQSYDIKVEYFQQAGPAKLTLFWSAAGIPESTIPATAFTTLAATTTPSATPKPTPTPTPTPAPTGTPKPTATPVATPTPSTPPVSSAKPGPTNTGYKHTGVVLSAYTGPSTITTANTVIDGKNLGCLDIRAANVTITRSLITCSDFYPVLIDSGNLIITDTEIAGSGGHALNGVDGSNFVATRVDVHGTSDGFDIKNNVTIQNSWTHDLWLSPGDHADGVQQEGGGNNIVLRGNFLDSQDHGKGHGESPNSAIQVDHGASSNFTIDGNWLIGTGGAYDINFRANGGTNNKITNNRIGRNILDAIDAEGSVTVSGNVYDDNGQPFK